MIILRQKSFSEEDENSKKVKKMAKAGIAVGTGTAIAGGLGHIIGKNVEKSAKKATQFADEKIKEAVTKKKFAPTSIIADRELQNNISKRAGKFAKRAGTAGIVGLGTAIGSGVAYKTLKKKEDKK